MAAPFSMSRRCRRTEYADRGGLWPAHRRDSADLLIRRARTRNRVLAHSTDRPGCNRHSARKGVPTEIRPGRRHCRTFRGKGANGPAVPCVTRELCDSTSARLFLACGRCRPLIQNKCPRRCAIMSRAAGPPLSVLDDHERRRGGRLGALPLSTVRRLGANPDPHDERGGQ